MIYIYAGEYRQAAWLGEWLGLDRDSWKYLASPRDLDGLHDPKVIRWGTARNRRDYNEMMDRISLQGGFILSVDDDIMRFAHYRS